MRRLGALSLFIRKWNKKKHSYRTRPRYQTMFSTWFFLAFPKAKQDASSTSAVVLLDSISRKTTSASASSSTASRQASRGSLISAPDSPVRRSLLPSPILSHQKPFQSSVVPEETAIASISTWMWIKW